MKIIVLVISAIFLCINIPIQVFCQFQGASVTDLRFSTTSTGVTNTGNDIIRDPQTGDNVMVTVWDGSVPGLGWDNFNSISGFTGLQRNDAFDPDVTLVRDGNNIHAIVV